LVKKHRLLMASKDTMTWNKFRSMHKGLSVNKLSSLWTDYKVGQYDLPEDNKSVTEEVVEEKAAKMKAAVVAVKEEPKAAQEGTQEEYLTEYKRLSNRMLRFGKSMSQATLDEGRAVLKDLAAKTAPVGYICTPTDGWKCWTGPSSLTLIVNENKRVAFLTSRDWWNSNYQGAFYVTYETVGDAHTIERLADQFKRQRKLVGRPPLAGIEIMLPKSLREKVNRSEVR
jgi:hypothetical protein